MPLRIVKGSAAYVTRQVGKCKIANEVDRTTPRIRSPDRISFVVVHVPTPSWDTKLGATGSFWLMDCNPHLTWKGVFVTDLVNQTVHMPTSRRK